MSRSFIYLFQLAALMASLLCTWPAFAQPQKGGVLYSSKTSKARNALLIGNQRYNGTFKRLNNPVRDVKLIAKQLRKLGFDVQVKTDLTRVQMYRALAAFKDKLREAKGTGLFYFAGHGTQGDDNENYLVPVDANPQNDEEIGIYSVSVRKILREMRRAFNQANIIVIDACRDRPFIGALAHNISRSRSRNTSDNGFVERNYLSQARNITITSEVPFGEVIIFSTDAGQTASDGSKRDKYSPFARIFYRQLQTGDRLEDVFGRTKRKVRLETGNQTPRLEGSIFPAFIFRPDHVRSYQKRLLEDWSALSQSNLNDIDLIQQYQNFLRKYPKDNPYKTQTQRFIELLERKQNSQDRKQTSKERKPAQIKTTPDECSEDNDCPGNKVCRSGWCEFECTDSESCGIGLKCMANRCADYNACDTKLDCDADQRCYAGFCTSLSSN